MKKNHLTNHFQVLILSFVTLVIFCGSAFAAVQSGTSRVKSSSSARRKPQVFSGTSAVFAFICNSTTAIRTVTFTKATAASRLRITYKDTASVAGPSGFSIAVVGRIDGKVVTNPTALRMIFGSSGGNGLFGVLSSFTAFGYVNGVAAGTHTFTSVYTYISNGATGTCLRSDEPFLIEIEEVP